MKRKSSSVSAKWSWLALSVALMAPTAVQATVKTAVEATSCQPQANTCPYPADLYQTDPTFRKTLETSLSDNGLVGLLGQEGQLNGPQGPMEPLKIDGQIYLKGSMCADGDCGDHNLTFLYQPNHHNFVGFYINHNDGQWVNTPGDGELKVLRALVKGEGIPAQNSMQSPAPVPAPAAASSDAPPPNTIWGFTDNKGKTLWEMCGGKQKTCVIAGNTKHVAAVWNHKSANGCALGDFYIIDRDDNSWQQRDTGTCSPNAWVRKGSINGGQYLSVDISVGDETVIQYPIGYWSDMKEFSGPNRPSWEKAKQAAKH
ncbi:TPA: Ivy family c-type lysozyme inhibitor [Yersinia enterocolitica]